jgi:hypothetical protein
MIIYSVTINIDNKVHDQWLKWMKNNYIPVLLNSGLIIENKILRLLTEVDNEGTTYSFQYYLNSIEDYKQLEHTFLPAIQNSLYDLYKNMYVEFTTLLEVV